MLAPASASASHSVFLDSVSPMQAGCQVKGLFGLPSPKAAAPGLAAGAYLYAVTAIVNGAEVTPACPYLRVPINGTASQDAVLLQWNVTPGAAAYRVYRGTYDPNTGAQLTQPVQLLTGAPFNAYPANCSATRCITQDRGAAPAAGPPAPAQPPAAPQAGGHPDLVITQRNDYGAANANPAADSLKTTQFSFPAGLVANPRSTRDANGNVAVCALTSSAPGQPSLLGDPDKYGSDDSDEDTCPRYTQVGTVQSLTLTPNGLQPTQGDIYNGETKAGEPARLFIVLRPACSAGSPVDPNTNPNCLNGLPQPNPGKKSQVEKQFLAAVSTINRRDDGSYGIDVNVVEAEDDGPLSPTLNILLPAGPGGAYVHNPAAVIPIQVRRIVQTLWGYADQGTQTTADDQPFVTLPTSCGVKTMSVQTTTQADPVAAGGSNAFTTNGCENVPFDPATQADPDTPQVEAPVGFGNSTILGADDDPIHQSHIRKITATFPRGLVLSSSSGAAIQAVGAQLGTVSGFSEELGDLTGTLTLQEVINDAAGHFTGQLVVRATVTDTKPNSETVLVLDGLTTADPATGQLTTVFDDLPEVPFKNLTLAFTGGPNAALVNPPTCGDHTVRQDIESWSGANAGVEDAFTTTFNGGSCAATRPFAPKMSATASPTQAAAFTALTTTITRADGEQSLAGFTLELPKGMLAKLGAIPLCPEANAAAGTCADSSKVGSVKIAAGTGSSPVQLPGTISLAEAVPGTGDIASLVVAIPVKVGPFDVGTVVSRARLQILFDPEVGVRVTTTGTLPTIAGGIPVRVRSLELLIDAPGFQRNPSSCAAKEFVATFTSQGDPTTAATAAEGGATSTARAPFNATGCDAVPFSPRIDGTVDASGGQDQKGGQPALAVTVRQNDDEAGTQSARVTLPGTITANVAGLENPCVSEAQLAANQCPALATVGSATATSPLLPGQQLTGPIVAVAQESNLPKLVVLLRGALSVRLEAFIDLDTTSRPPLIKIVNTFPSIPDVPLSTFTLNLKGGAQGLFTNAVSLCSGIGNLDGVFKSHNGKSATVSSPLSVTGAKACPAERPTAQGRLYGVKRGRADMTLDVGRDDAKGNLRLKSVRVTLPKGLTIRKAAARRRLTATSNDRALSRRTLRLSSRQVTVSRLGSGKSRIELRFRPNSLKVSRTLRRRGRNQTLTVRLRVVDRANRVYNLSVRLRPRS